VRTASLAGLVVLTLAAQAVAGCKIIWHEEEAAEAGPRAFDAATYVGGIWDTQVIPHFTAQAADAATIADAVAGDPGAAGEQFGHRAGPGSPWTYAVRGEGRVVAVDTASRRGLMRVDVGPPGKPREVVLQIGPVVVGTALRDNLPFVSFGNFVNQLEFAQVSRSLNDRAVATIRTDFPFDSATGKVVRFAGAAIQASADQPLQVTPVSLELAGSGS